MMSKRKRVTLRKVNEIVWMVVLITCGLCVIAGISRIIFLMVGL